MTTNEVPADLLFLDCETTGLDPLYDQPWEVSAALWNPARSFGTKIETWTLRLSEDEQARMANLPDHFQEIFARNYREATAITRGLFVSRFKEWLNENAINPDQPPHLVAAVPSFDHHFVGQLFYPTPPWHYHLVCVENLIAGRFQINPPWDSNTLSRMVGVEPDDYDRHTSAGDVAWAFDLYRSVMA